MYFIGYGCAQIGPADNPAAFRIPWGIQMIPAILLFLLLPMFPRSPRWLAGQGRWDEAIETLAMINAKGNRDDPEVVAEIAEIPGSCRAGKERRQFIPCPPQTPKHQPCLHKPYDPSLAAARGRKYHDVLCCLCL